jgi:Ca2+/Na+ antiporter
MQFSLKSIFILITLAAILAPVVQLMGGLSYFGTFVCLLFYALIGTLMISAYRKKTAWRDQDESAW